MSKYTLNVSLTPELVGMVREAVDSGRYGNQSEVIRDALRLLKEREDERAAKIAWLRTEVQKGLDDIDAGRVVELDAEDIKARGRKRYLNDREA